MSIAWLAKKPVPPGQPSAGMAGTFNWLTLMAVSELMEPGALVVVAITKLGERFEDRTDDDLATELQTP